MSRSEAGFLRGGGILVRHRESGDILAYCSDLGVATRLAIAMGGGRVVYLEADGYGDVGKVMLASARRVAVGPLVACAVGWLLDGILDLERGNIVMAGRLADEAERMCELLEDLTPPEKPGTVYS